MVWAAVGWVLSTKPRPSNGSKQETSQLTAWFMGPTWTSLAAAVPSSKVKYSKVSSADGEHIDFQKETSPADEGFTFQRCLCVLRPRVFKCKNRPSKTPYKAIALATMQFLIGTSLVITGCLLLAGYIKRVDTSRAISVLIVGVLVFLPGFYHLLSAYRAHQGHEGCSYRDLPDCG